MEVKGQAIGDLVEPLTFQTAVVASSSSFMLVALLLLVVVF